LNRERKRMKAHNFQYWPIFMLGDNQLVGGFGLQPYGTDAAIPELGFHLRPRYWGRGLAVEAARAAIRYAFDVIGAKGSAAGHHPGNANSKKTMMKLGFTYTHDEFFPALGMSIPYYLLNRQDSGSRSLGCEPRTACMRL
jgi:ribosomal-protein-alanine N-acetyltransferase